MHMIGHHNECKRFRQAGLLRFAQDADYVPA